jgi:hypothetical protein
MTTISDRKLEANRLNAQKSTGPRTPEGKARSALNGVRHGTLARAVCLRSESTDAFRSFADQFYAEHCPVTPTEIALVNTIISARWRLIRVCCLEAVNIDFEYARHHDDLHDVVPEDFGNADRTGQAYLHTVRNSRVLDQIGRTEARLTQVFEKALARLHELQAERRKAEKNLDGLKPPSPLFQHLGTNPPTETL